MQTSARCDLQKLRLETCPDARDILTGCDTERRACLELIGLRKLPATKSLVDQTAPALERNAIDGVQSEHLTDVVVRVPAETFCVEEVGQEVFLERAAVL